MANEKENETQYELQPIAYEEIRKIPDNTLAIMYLVIGAVVMVISPLVIPGLIG